MIEAIFKLLAEMSRHADSAGRTPRILDLKYWPTPIKQAHGFIYFAHSAHLLRFIRTDVSSRVRTLEIKCFSGLQWKQI